MYRRGPTGEYFVGVCTNTLCAVMGGDAIFESLKDHLGIGNDETTDDGSVTLQHIECNAACDFAPVVMVNWEFYDNQTVESAHNSSTGCAPETRRRPPVVRCAHSKRPSGSWQVSPTRGQTTARAVPARRHWPAWRSPRSAI